MSQSPMDDNRPMPVGAGLAPDPVSPGGTGAVEMVRSEERLVTGTRTQVTGRVRLHKRLVSENVTKTVTVRREELVIDEDKVDVAALEPVPGHEFGDRDYEIILREERVVVSTQLVAVERVRIRVRTVTENVSVSDVVSREQIELTGDQPTVGLDPRR